MIIKKMTASFGKLSGDSIELKDGLNVVCAPNESGKSTWCAFIRAMLYGVDSSERARGTYLPDKQKYAPWSGANMEGEMELEYEGKSICISRTTKLKNAPMREFSAVYTGTNVPVEGMTGSNAGELLTGTGKEVFRRSAMVEQGAVTVSSSPELEKRIASIVSTGDEGCSFSEADEQLRAWQRKRKYNRRGMLPELEGRIGELEAQLGELNGSAAEQERLSQLAEDHRKDCRRLEEMVTESRKTTRKEALATLQSRRKELNDATDKYAAAKDSLDAAEDAFNVVKLSEFSPDEAEKRAAEDMGKCRALKEKTAEKASILPFVIAFIIAAAGFALMFFTTKYSGIVGVVGLAAGVLLTVKYCGKKKEISAAAAELMRLLSNYEAEDEGGIAQCLEKYKKLHAEFKAAEEQESRAASALAAARIKQEKAENETLTALDFTDGSSEAAKLGRELASAQSDCDRLSARISELKGRIDTLGDPVVLASELESLREEYETISAEYDALSLAIDTLRAADTDIQSRFSPELGKTAAEYMSIITDGKYESLLINRDFTARTRLSGDAVSREAAYLSAGTLDLMYLAVRLAVCALALPDKASCPLILDDTLVNLDDERSEKAMKLLGEIAKTRQVILFTCKNIKV